MSLTGKAPTIFQGILCVILLLVIALMSFGTLFVIDVSLETETRDVIEAYMLRTQATDGEESVLPKQISISLPILIDSLRPAADLAREWKDAVQNSSSLASEHTSGVSQEVMEVAIFFTMLSQGFSRHWVVAVFHVLLIVLIALIPIKAVLSALNALISFFLHLYRPGRGFYKTSTSFSRVVGVMPLLLLLLLAMPHVHLGAALYSVFAWCMAGVAINFIVSRLKYYDPPERRYLNLLQLLSLGSLCLWCFCFYWLVRSDMIESVLGFLKDHPFSELFRPSLGGALLRAWLMVAFILCTVAMLDGLWQSLTALACMSRSRSDTHLILGLVAPIMAVLPYLSAYGSGSVTLDGVDWAAYGLAAMGLLGLYAIELFKKLLFSILCRDVKRSHRRQIITGSYVYKGLGEEEK